MAPGGGDPAVTGTTVEEADATRPGRREPLPGTGPVVRYLIRTARRDADRIRAEAAAHAAATVGRARAEADALLADARAAGAAEGAALAAENLIRARREARAIVLRARRDACERLRAQVRAAVSALVRDDPALADRLRALARDLAGAGAEIVPGAGGGFIARGDGTLVDCSPSALADRAFEALGAEVERLWAP
ncbi:hypothetical protein [Actinoallomurus soli]|uniref:hypothetical protein n=1 Tax=Actinoallomurus soli TaxID=2952535 RepID=UPI002092226A|nr:hypothetical protein [Actinoallomurus soli]MCO5967793.1 hypothetical protein [Actinoallomurus soli]